MNVSSFLMRKPASETSSFLIVRKLAAILAFCSALTSADAFASPGVQTTGVRPFHLAPNRMKPRKLRLIEGTADENIRAVSGSDSTGRKIWDAGHALSRLLTNNSDSLLGKQILELGSGTGIVGLTAAAEGATVCLTDGAMSLLPMLEANVEENDLQHRARVRCLQWGDEEEIAAVASEGPFDMIIGSDLLYSPESFPELVDTLAALCIVNRTEVLLAYPARFTEPIFFKLANVLFDEVEWVEIEPAVFLTRLVKRK